jgi:hypothetical protein
MDVTLSLAYTLAGVLGIAAAGKFVGHSGAGTFAVAVGELALAGALLLQGSSTLVAAIVLGVTLIYAVYALTRDPENTCHCFGTRLPASTRVAQLGRNLALFALAVGYWIAVVLSRRGPAYSPGADLVVGLMVAVAIVGLPWLFQWAAAGGRAGAG